VQWKEKACDGPDQCIPVGEIEIKIMQASKTCMPRRRRSSGTHPEPYWNYLDKTAISARKTPTITASSWKTPSSKTSQRHENRIQEGATGAGFGNLQADGKRRAELGLFRRLYATASTK
jgi:hypothetical protein